MHGIFSRVMAFAISAAGPTAVAAAQVQGAVAAGGRADSVAAQVVPDSTSATFVLFRGDTLFRLYGRLGPFGPAERAAAVSSRLGDLSRSAANSPDTVAVVERADFSELVARGITIMSVLDSDAAPLSRPRSAVARDYATQIQRSLGAARERLSARALLIDAGYAAAATIVLLIALTILHLGFPRIYRRLEAIRRSRVPSLRIQQLELLSADGLAQALLVVARIARAAATLLLLYVYVPLVLSFFPWTEPLSRRIVGYALTPLAATWHAFVAFVPSLFYLLVIVLVTRYVLKLVHAIFLAIENGAITFAGFYPEWADPTYKIARVMVIALAAVLCFPYLPGAHTDAFKGSRCSSACSFRSARPLQSATSWRESCSPIRAPSRSEIACRWAKPLAT